jgi:hypothetical protein
MEDFSELQKQEEGGRVQGSGEKITFSSKKCVACFDIVIHNWKNTIFHRCAFKTILKKLL